MNKKKAADALSAGGIAHVIRDSEMSDARLDWTIDALWADRERLISGFRPYGEPIPRHRTMEGK